MAMSYEEWLQQSLQIFNVRYSDSRTLPEVPMAFDYQPEQVVEFSEEGDAYPHGIGGTNWIKNAVPPFAPE